jgi:hypothetical protein
MADQTSDSGALTYGEVRAALSRRSDFESYQEGVGKSPHYVLNVRPRSTRCPPFTRTGPDLAQLLRDALDHLADQCDRHPAVPTTHPPPKQSP